LCQRLVGQENFAPAFRHGVEAGRPDEIVVTGQSGLECEQVIALGLRPKVSELRIVDKYLGRARLVGTIFQAQAAVQHQASAVRIEEHRGKGVVMMVRDEFARRRLLNRDGQRTRAQVRIEDNHRQTSRVEKQDHHQCGGQKRALAGATKSPRRTGEKRDSGKKQRQAKVCE